MRHLLLLLPALLLACGSAKENIRPPLAESYTSRPWDSVLQRSVDAEGYVDYAIAMAMPEFERYVRLLNSAKPSQMADDRERLAFWINAYNALTFQLLFDNWPVGSITDIADGLAGISPSPLRSPWEVPVVTVEGETLTLQEIEDNKVRKLGDERIHFAINCASISCPRLLNRAWSAERLEEMYNEARRRFLADRRQNRLEGGKLHLSRIFDWYRDDFIRAEGSVTGYVAKHWPNPTEAAAIARIKDGEVEYLDYDWRLVTVGNKHLNGR